MDSIYPYASIGKELERQSVAMGGDNFICVDCKFHKDGYGCEKNVFVAFVGANMSGCRFYERGVKCPHCGRNH